MINEKQVLVFLIETLLYYEEHKKDKHLTMRDCIQHGYLGKWRKIKNDRQDC